MTKELPVELIMEILSWLPVKSLLRFRSVSTTWLQLLTTNSQFIKLHLQRISRSTNNHPGMVALRLPNEGNPSLYYVEDCMSWDEGKIFELPCDCDKYFSNIFGVCNGLICLVNHDEEYLFNMPEIYIWNPFIGDHITLPSPTLPMGPGPGSDSGMFSFGYHHISNEYKVVRIVESITLKLESHAEVYTLGMDSWRRLETISYVVDFLNVVVVNGVIHWYGYKVDCNVIIAFDIKDETFQEIPCPPGVDSKLCNVKIGELGRLLCMFCMFSENEVSKLQIWVMKEYGVVESWTEEFKIGRSDVFGKFTFLQPLGVTRDGEIILKKDNSEVILYSPKMGTCKEPKGFASLCYDANTYIGSLVSPKSFSGHNAET